MQRKELHYGTIVLKRRKFRSVLHAIAIVIKILCLPIVRPVLRYGGDDAAQSCMSVRFNSMGTMVKFLFVFKYYFTFNI